MPQSPQAEIDHELATEEWLEHKSTETTKSTAIILDADIISGCAKPDLFFGRVANVVDVPVSVEKGSVSFENSKMKPGAQTIILKKIRRKLQVLASQQSVDLQTYSLA